MTTVAVASIADAPGASTLAVGLVSIWPVSDPPPVLLEADPDGGRLGTRMGVGVEPGLMSLALASRTRSLSVDELVAVAAPVGDWLLLPTPPSAEQTHSALLYSAAGLAGSIADDRTRGWVVDAGRMSPRSPSLPFAVRGDHLLVVTKGDLAALQLVPSRLDALRAAGARDASLVVVGETFWPPEEIAAFAGCDVAAQLPTVRPAGGYESMGGRPWRAWWQAVSDLALLIGGDRTGSVEVVA